MRGGGNGREDTTTSQQLRGLREAEQEATAQREVRPCNSNERQSGRQMGGGRVRRGNATTSWTSGTGGHGATRGNSTMMDNKGTGRWEVAA